MLLYSLINITCRVIKMSSPRLNNIIAIGSVLCYASIIVFGIDRKLVENDNGLKVVCAVSKQTVFNATLVVAMSIS